MVRVITPPADEPVTLAQAKLHCRVDHNDEDTLFDALITAARVYCEGVQNRAYITQTLAITLDDFPATPYDLPMPPLQGNVEITYTDEDGVSDTVDSDDYVVDTTGYKGRIRLKRDATWPDDILQEIGAVTIQFDAGYGAAADVPQSVKQAMLLLIGHWYANRESSMTGHVNREIEFAVNALLSLDRVWPI